MLDGFGRLRRGRPDAERGSIQLEGQQNAKGIGDPEGDHGLIDKLQEGGGDKRTLVVTQRLLGASSIYIATVSL